MQERRLRTSYDNKDFHRAVTYAIPSPGVLVGFANGRIFFELELEPGQEWQTCGELIFEHGQHVMEPAYGHRTSEQLVEPLSELDELQERWLWNFSISCPARTVPCADGSGYSMPLLDGKTTEISVGAGGGTARVSVFGRTSTHRSVTDVH